jgi:hypothetical protein
MRSYLPLGGPSGPTPAGVTGPSRKTSGSDSGVPSAGPPAPAVAISVDRAPRVGCFASLGGPGAKPRPADPLASPANYIVSPQTAARRLTTMTSELGADQPLELSRPAHTLARPESALGLVSPRRLANGGAAAVLPWQSVSLAASTWQCSSSTIAPRSVASRGESNMILSFSLSATSRLRCATTPRPNRLHRPRVPLPTRRAKVANQLCQDRGDQQRAASAR